MRKTLIMKQRKLTLFSRIDSSYFKMVWVILFGTIYSAVCLFEIETIGSHFEFLREQWLHSYKSVIWANSIHLSSYLLQNQYELLGDTTITDFRDANKKNFFNSLVREKELLEFSQKILMLQNDTDFK